MYKLLYIPTCEYIHGKINVGNSYTSILTKELLQRYTVNCYLASASKDRPAFTAEDREVFEYLLAGEDIYKHIAIDLEPIRWKHYVIYKSEFEIVEIKDETI